MSENVEGSRSQSNLGIHDAGRGIYSRDFMCPGTVTAVELAIKNLENWLTRMACSSRFGSYAFGYPTRPCKKQVDIFFCLPDNFEIWIVFAFE
jgi:hypothetical protein